MGEISNLIKQATRDPEHGAPGIVFQAIDRNGKVLNSTASGVRGLDDKHPMTMDTTFWIASCTKMVTSIALMQLVEQGKADLDSADQLEKVVPEMREVKIIEGVDENGKPKLREKKNRITLRMLQTHIGTLHLRLTVKTGQVRTLILTQLASAILSLMRISGGVSRRTQSMMSFRAVLRPSNSP